MPYERWQAGNLQILQTPVLARVTNFKQACSPYKMMFIEHYAHQIELTVSENGIHDNIMTTDSTQLIRYEEKLWLNQ